MTDTESNAQVQADNEARLLERRGEISAYGRSRRSYRQFLFGLALCVLAIAVVIGVGVARSINGESVTAVLVVLAATVVLAGWYVARYARQHFVEPDQALRKWLQSVCDGDTDTRIDLDESHPHYRELNFHTRNLGQALTRLSTDMDELVEMQTSRLAEQNRSLDLLCRLTGDVANVSDEKTVFDTVCRHLANWYGDAVVGAYLERGGEQTHLVTHRSSNIKGDDTRSGATDEAKVESVTRITHVLSLNGAHRHVTSIPFFDGGRTAGVLYVQSTEQYPAGETETLRLLQSISEQLSMFFAQRRAQEESRTMQAVKERSDLAADIHDSLAQTLAALRYQVNMVEDSIDTRDESGMASRLKPEIDRLKGTIAEANQDVRGLIGEYRKPLAREGRFVDSLKQVVNDAQKKTDTPIYFQNDNPHLEFSRREESQLLKIVGEALHNATKYANAQMIRVYLSADRQGARRIVIEDDGAGFHMDDAQLNLPDVSGANGGAQSHGDHIGLSIMQERAEAIGARLSIESEPGEGTSVFVELSPSEQTAR